MKLIRREKGITLITLIITIIVLCIIAGISIIGGTNLVNTSKAETIETNMLTIKGKAKEYMENVDSLNWASKQEKKEEKNRAELTGDKYKLTLIEDATQYINSSKWYKDEDKYTYYALERKAIDKMGLPDLYEDGKVYIIKYPTEPTEGTIDENLELDIIYANGITYQNNTYYNLSKLQEVL